MFGVIFHVNGGNIFINSAISSLVEVIALIFCMVFTDRIGHTRLYCPLMILGGVSCLCTIFTSLYAADRKYVILKILSSEATRPNNIAHLVYFYFINFLLGFSYFGIKIKYQKTKPVQHVKTPPPSKKKEEEKNKTHQIIWLLKVYV
jgi:MFS family permease